MPIDCGELVGSQQRGLSNGQRRALPFELRGADVVDLLVDFEQTSRMNVVVGIPAARWFTNAVIRDLEAALIDLRGDAPLRQAETMNKPVIVELGTNSASLDSERRDTVRRDAEESYRLVEDDAIDPRDLRQ